MTALTILVKDPIEKIILAMKYVYLIISSSGSVVLTILAKDPIQKIIVAMKYVYLIIIEWVCVEGLL